MNLYATVAEVVAQGRIPSSEDGAFITSLIESASRAADDFCKRRFFLEYGERIYSPRTSGLITDLEDCQRVDLVEVDVDNDLTFSEAVSPSNYMLQPFNRWPKTELQFVDFWPFGRVKVTGFFGFGDGQTNLPAFPLNLAVTIDDDDASFTDESGTIKAGWTLLIDDELIYVTSIETTTVNITRGINGTTAEAHTSGDIYKTLLPPAVNRFVITLASNMYHRRDGGEITSERIGDYSYTLATGPTMEEFTKRALWAYRRVPL